MRSFCRITAQLLMNITSSKNNFRLPVFVGFTKCHQNEISEFLNSWHSHPSTIATALIQPALARSIFTGKQLSVNPNGGNAFRLVSFSIW